MFHPLFCLRPFSARFSALVPYCPRVSLPGTCFQTVRLTMCIKQNQNEESKKCVCTALFCGEGLQATVLSHLSFWSAEIYCATGSVQIRFLRKNCGPKFGEIPRWNRPPRSCFPTSDTPVTRRPSAAFVFPACRGFFLFLINSCPKGLCGRKKTMGWERKNERPCAWETGQTRFTIWGDAIYFCVIGLQLFTSFLFLSSATF